MNEETNEEIRELYNSLVELVKDRPKTVYKCEHCQDSGWIKVEGKYNTYTECHYCNKFERARRDNQLKFANLPQIYENNTLSDFKIDIYSNKANREIAKSVADVVGYWLANIDKQEEEGRGLYFYSKCKGSGKTFVMSGIANALMSIGREVKFATSIDIINEIKKTWDRKNNPQNTESESELLRQLSECEYLFIDDFGTEKVKDWMGERFYSIINARYNNRKITCYSSNINLKYLDYDERITSRIKGTTYVVEFPAEDIRIKQGIEAHNAKKVEKEYQNAKRN